MNVQVSRKEIYRYLGYGNHLPDAEIQELVEQSIEDLQPCSFRSVQKCFSIDVLTENEIWFADIHIRSKDLGKNLKNCTKCVCMAATLGPLPDRLIQRAKILDLSKAVVLQAVGCALIESYVDQINEQIRQDAQNQGYICHPRYSCGYGDFDLNHQKDFIRLLEMPITIGVSLTQGNLMIPNKSVTAVIGWEKK